MRGLLDHIEQYRGVKRGDWAREIIKVVEMPDHAKRLNGFADYESYAAFVKLQHPEAMEVWTSSQTWVHNTQHGVAPNAKNDCCAHPDDFQTWLQDGIRTVQYESHKQFPKQCMGVNLHGLPQLLGASELKDLEYSEG